MKKVKIQGSICWNCKLVCTNECKKPIAGWTAFYRPLPGIYENELLPSWYVVDCPLYKEERDDVVIIHKNVKPRQSVNTMRGMLYYEDDYHTVKDLALRCHMSERTIRRLLSLEWTPENILAFYNRDCRNKNVKTKKIIGIEIKTGTKAYWNSVVEAVNDEKHSFKKKYILRVLNGKQKSHMGWMFRESMR